MSEDQKKPKTYRDLSIYSKRAVPVGPLHPIAVHEAFSAPHKRVAVVESSEGLLLGHVDVKVEHGAVLQ